MYVHMCVCIYIYVYIFILINRAFHQGIHSYLYFNPK